jgi:hypothetical protein
VVGWGLLLGTAPSAGKHQLAGTSPNTQPCGPREGRKRKRSVVAPVLHQRETSHSDSGLFDHDDRTLFERIGNAVKVGEDKA